jgi:hypothetical protein
LPHPVSTRDLRFAVSSSSFSLPPQEHGKPGIPDPFLVAHRPTGPERTAGFSTAFIHGSWIVDRGSWIVDWSRNSTDRKTHSPRTKKPRRHPASAVSSSPSVFSVPSVVKILPLPFSSPSVFICGVTPQDKDSDHGKHGRHGTEIQLKIASKAPPQTAKLISPEQKTSKPPAPAVSSSPSVFSVPSVVKILPLPFSSPSVFICGVTPQYKESDHGKHGRRGKEIQLKIASKAPPQTAKLIPPEQKNRSLHLSQSTIHDPRSPFFPWRPWRLGGSTSNRPH